MAQEITRNIEFPDNQHAALLYGDLNRNLQLLEKGAGISINARGNAVTLQGIAHQVELVEQLLNQLYAMVTKGRPIYSSDVAFGLRILESSPTSSLEKIFSDKVYITTQNRVVSPKTPNQKIYIDAIRNNDIVFGIGPAGTGKTYLAVAMAVSALTNNRVRSIILTRPAVEAGEKLGFLPGDMAQKIDPYLRPLHDALNDMLGAEKAFDLIERGTIEVAPLAFMRGRTLSNAFVILDEAQNTTQEQMKMFLTRIGFDSMAVITGDATQVDLPTRSRSGLLEAQQILKEISGIQICRFGREDVVRHPLVQKIIEAYTRAEA